MADNQYFKYDWQYFSDSWFFAHRNAFAGGWTKYLSRYFSVIFGKFVHDGRYFGTFAQPDKTDLPKKLAIEIKTQFWSNLINLGVPPVGVGLSVSPLRSRLPLSLQTAPVGRVTTIPHAGGGGRFFA